ncbi:MAG: class I SAM-dependent RNA methyltransferase [Flavobacteriales bacterium]
MKQESTKNLTITLKCFFGFETVLQEELVELGYPESVKGNRAITLKGTWRDVYFLNLHSRCAVSILVEICTFPFKTEQDVYDASASIRWSSIFHEKNTIAIRGAIQTKKVRNTHYPFLLVKDGISDHFRSVGKERPSVDIKHPKIAIDLYLNDQEGVLSINTSGLPLFQRGYRTATGPAPINEVVAACLLRLSGWDRKTPFYDPFCGSGTFLIEAALLATGIPSNIERNHYAFKNLITFDEACWEEILAQTTKIVRSLPCTIGGSDISDEMVLKARRNLRGFSFGRYVSVQSLSFDSVKASKDIQFIMSNPPYDERIAVEGDNFYRDLGRWMKHEMTGIPQWIINSNSESWNEIGLKPTVKHAVFNGNLPCEFRRYDTYSGRNKEDLTFDPELERSSD